MTDAPTLAATREIVVDEVLPHAPAIVWKTLTTPELMGRWLMQPDGFEPREGNRFTYKTTPQGAWDGTIQCRVLEVRPDERLSYAWVGGHEANEGYGSRLDTVVTFTLSPVEGGTRLRLVHAGFKPENEHAYQKMSGGWPGVVKRIGDLAETH